ncbi:MULTISPECIES: nucleoside triphosphate pyrophosphohydrolase [unclassified Acidisoma]|jgi:ATP diphosphatase|uniref:nucleoside triphosphate pyrophosphohydrolase n=1 Tax=unclassified Acidisoma TaxID=2634065 RepID=UPI00131C0548|nr:MULTISPECIES: nucleoside triphosphate pyrophosphohydrolase [unclassified Acidisoma]
MRDDAALAGEAAAGAETALRDLLDLMARLRDPEHGCPWDRAQSFATIAPYTIEEAYEVAEAIEGGEPSALRDELGDLLFQVVFHARMAEEQGLFSFADVASGITAKMRRRHPHVFGDAGPRDATTQNAAWEAQKAAERAAKPGAPSALSGVAVNLPALTRAEKLSARAARVGFDWPDLDQLFAKLDEEVAELKAEIAGARQDRLADEIGDLLFVVANLCRKLGLDAEASLRGANAKFTRRFQGIEARLAATGRVMTDEPLDVLEAHWQEVKRGEGA